MTTRHAPTLRLSVGAAAALLTLIGCSDATSAGTADAPTARDAKRAAEIAQRYGVALLPPPGIDLTTPFSKVHLQDVGLHRALFFVRDDGSLYLQTQLNLAQPHVLLLPYSRTMFASYLFVPEPSRVLIVGLGGGSMVRYLERRDPALQIDAIDIDPEMLGIADRYFGTRPSERVRLWVADGYELIRTSADLYDVIYMDAFLRPSEESDHVGVPARMKEAPFYAALRARLTPTGVVAFNVNPSPERDRDMDDLRRAFPQVYVFDLANDASWVAVATLEPERRSPAELEALAAAVAPRFDGDVDYSDMVKRVRPAV